MKFAFVIYERMTALDFIGAYDALVRLKTMKFIPSLEWDVRAIDELVDDGLGLKIAPTKVGGLLEGYDVLIIPGGYGSRTLKGDVRFVEWIGTARQVPLKTSVCTGSLLLGAAGFLKGKRATTHRSAFDELRPYCEAVVDERIVDEGDVITARGVASSIDLGLYLCEKLAGAEARERISKQMDYHAYALAKA